MHLQVIKYDYLKSPYYSVTLHNDEGGSSRSSGNLKTLKAVGSHIWFGYAQPRIVEPDTRVIVETWHGFDENEEPVTTSEFTDVDAMLARIGTTRNLTHITQ